MQTRNRVRCTLMRQTHRHHLYTLEVEKVSATVSASVRRAGVIVVANCRGQQLADTYQSANMFGPISIRSFVAVAALVALATGLFQLRAISAGIEISRMTVGETPVTIFRPQSDATVPVVVIAHGFAGSQQLMQPFAETLAQNGYIAVTFDFLGHGRNPLPMRGDITEGKTITAELLKELTEVAAAARKLPRSNGRLAVLGHSMASDIVVRFAQANPDVEATVAVSVFSPVVTPASQRNLLVIVGALRTFDAPKRRPANRQPHRWRISRRRRDLWRFFRWHRAQTRTGPKCRAYRRALQP